MDAFFQQAALCAARGLAVRPLYRMTALPSEAALLRLAEADVGALVSRAEWVEPCRAAGIRDIFLDCAALLTDEMAGAFGKCHFILHNQSELARLDKVAFPLLREGYLEGVTVALRLAGDGDDFTPQNIPLLARLIRRSDALAVRGVLLDLSGQVPLSDAATDAFSLIKKIRSDLPCILHYFCFTGLLEPLAAGDEALTRTVEILSSLNDTSLYADFFLG